MSLIKLKTIEYKLSCLKILCNYNMTMHMRTHIMQLMEVTNNKQKPGLRGGVHINNLGSQQKITALLSWIKIIKSATATNSWAKISVILAYGKINAFNSPNLMS